MATCLERWLPGTRLPHDHSHDYDNENTKYPRPVFSVFPTSDEIRNTTASRKCSPIITSSSLASKRKPATASSTPGSLVVRSSAKTTRRYVPDEDMLPMELHQSTCLNLSTPTAERSESDLWILPDFDDWEFENDLPKEDSPAEEENSQGASLLERAVRSNRERLRRRLEGDGWDFVGGRYGEGSRCELSAYGTTLEAESKRSGQDELRVGFERVDEEFNAVVLPVIHVAS